MRKFFRPMNVTVGVFAVSLLASAPALAKSKLKMSSWFPAQNALMVKGLVPWTKQIAKVTEGRVKVRILKKTVGSVSGQFDVAQSGQADITFGNQSYNQGRFKQYAFVELPGGGNSAEVTSVAYWRTYTKFFKDNDELADVKLLSLFTHGPGQLFTTDHVVTSLDGNKGVKIRGGGVAATRVVDEMGMTSVQAPFSKAAEMIASGIVDGAMFDRSIVPVVGFDRYFKNRFVYDGGLFNVSYFVVMNKDTWNEISDKDKAAIEAISGEALARTMGAIWDEEGEKGDAILDKKGVKTVLPSEQLRADLDKIFQTFADAWIKDMSASGIDGRAVLDAYRAEVKKLSK